MSYQININSEISILITKPCVIIVWTYKAQLKFNGVVWIGSTLSVESNISLISRIHKLKLRFRVKYNCMYHIIYTAVNNGNSSKQLFKSHNR